MVDGNYAEYFGVRLNDAQLSRLQSETKHVIASLEIVPVVTALGEWSERMLHRSVFFFVDNDAARASLIKMHSDVCSMRVALLRAEVKMQESPCFPWFGRVPSSSNPGDAPSRLVKLQIKIKAKQIQVNLDWLARE